MDLSFVPGWSILTKPGQRSVVANAALALGSEGDAKNWVPDSDAVLFATRKFRTQTEDAGFGRKRSIAKEIGNAGGERILRCVGGPSCIAKNRYGIDEEIDLSWTAFINALSTTNQLTGETNG